MDDHNNLDISNYLMISDRKSLIENLNLMIKLGFFSNNKYKYITNF